MAQNAKPAAGRQARKDKPQKKKKRLGQIRLLAAGSGARFLCQHARTRETRRVPVGTAGSAINNNYYSTYHALSPALDAGSAPMPLVCAFLPCSNSACTHAYIHTQQIKIEDYIRALDGRVKAGRKQKTADAAWGRGDGTSIRRGERCAVTTTHVVVGGEEHAQRDVSAQVGVGQDQQQEILQALQIESIVKYKAWQRRSSITVVAG